MPWGAPPGGQASPPFGSHLLTTPPLRPMTSMPPTVRQVYVKIGFVCLLDYFTFIYMSFRAAQYHNKAMDRDTASLTPSGTWREDPTATTWRRSFIFAFACRSFSFAFAYRELYCLELLNFTCHELYILSCCCVWYILCSLPVLEAHREAAKISSSKKIKLIYSSVSRRL
jgi:hypothetical protein